MSHEPGTGDEVDPKEPVSRFIFSRKEFSEQRVKYAAFLPYLGKKSIFRIVSLSEKEIWVIGWEVVGKTRESSLKARGDLPAEAVLARKLKILPEPSIHPRHADITGWPAADDESLMVATQLADEATLHIAPDKSKEA